MHACKTLLLEVVQAVYYLWYSIALFKSVYGILCKYFTQNMSIQHCLLHGQKDVRRHSFSTFFYLLTKKGPQLRPKDYSQEQKHFHHSKAPLPPKRDFLHNEPAGIYQNRLFFKMLCAQNFRFFFLLRLCLKKGNPQSST